MAVAVAVTVAVMGGLVERIEIGVGGGRIGAVVAMSLLLLSGPGLSRRGRGFGGRSLWRGCLIGRGGIGRVGIRGRRCVGCILRGSGLGVSRLLELGQLDRLRHRLRQGNLLHHRRLAVLLDHDLASLVAGIAAGEHAAGVLAPGCLGRHDRLGADWHAAAGLQVFGLCGGRHQQGKSGKRRERDKSLAGIRCHGCDLLGESGAPS